MKIAFYTLGCKVNQADTQWLRDKLFSTQWQEVDFTASADVYIINTCTVTHLADRKSRQAIRRAFKNNPLARIYVTGCGVQNPGALNLGIPAANITMVPAIQREQLLKSLTQAASNGAALSWHKTRAFLKVQDGCDNSCSYCIVPLVRGPARSKPLNEIKMELEACLKSGHKEIVLCGVHLGAYGKDLNPSASLPGLLKELLSQYAIPRLRLSSIEPQDFTPELLEVMAAFENICPHLHLPLQHSSNRILSAMNRTYTLEGYKAIINNILRSFPYAAISTDILTGFPGETEADFNHLLNYIKIAPFSRLHVFKFSPRPGTRAFNFKPQVPYNLKHTRSTTLIALGKQKMHEFIAKFQDRYVEVLFERKVSEGLYAGLSKEYFTVNTQGQFSSGDRAKVKIVRVDSESAYGLMEENLNCNGCQA